MASIELIKQLRALTNAGMGDCKSAIEEANGDLDKAVDIIKVRGQAISDSRSAKVASEGRVFINSALHNKLSVMVEVNSQTDFVANSQGFIEFGDDTADLFLKYMCLGQDFNANVVEASRKELVASTRENIVVRRWWAEESTNPAVRVFSYLHSNNKIGVLLTMQAPSEAAADSPEFKALGEDLTMQIAAMNPLAVSPDRLDPAEVAHQKSIFETQLKEDAKPKPEAMWPKILEGKFKKWNTEVCLLEQESVLVPKNSVKQVIQGISSKLGGEITVINFVRAVVGDGIEKKQDNLAEEVSKLM